LLVFVAKYTEKLLFVQVCAIMFSSACSIAYLTTYKPFEEPLLLKLEIFNDICMVILADIICFFSAANNSEIDTTMDITFIAFLFSNVLVHLYFLVKDTVLSLKERIKNRCCRKKQRPEEQTAEKKVESEEASDNKGSKYKLDAIEEMSNEGSYDSEEDSDASNVVDQEMQPSSQSNRESHPQEQMQHDRLASIEAEAARQGIFDLNSDYDLKSEANE